VEVLDVLDVEVLVLVAVTVVTVVVETVVSVVVSQFPENVVSVDGPHGTATFPPGQSCAMVLHLAQVWVSA
jgi:hypothetical protein